MKGKILILTLVGFLIIAGLLQNSLKFASAASTLFKVEFLGDEIDGGPIFQVSNMLPGDCEEREVVVTNIGSGNLEIFVRSENEVNNNLADALSWEIKKDVTPIYTSQLTTYYADNSPLSVGTFAPNESHTYHFKACFDINAGNEYQNTSTMFDLIFYSKNGHSTNLPPECRDMKIKNFIIGDEGNNTLKGTNKSDFIDGKGGNDQIFGDNEGDCLVGGPGNDKIDGQNGDDIIIGGDGNDTIDSGNGPDKVWGGPGNDNIKGQNGPDYLNGGPDIDTINGGLSPDTCVEGENLISCEL